MSILNDNCSTLFVLSECVSSSANSDSVTDGGMIEIRRHKVNLLTMELTSYKGLLLVPNIPVRYPPSFVISTGKEY